MSNFTSILNQLEQERSRLAFEVGRLNTILATLKQVSGNSALRTSPISAAGRARIAAAQRARWAKLKRHNVVSINSRKRRKLSASALARIRAAQKARWAKWRRQQKTA